MIQIYSPDNRDYTKNGDMTLFPTEATPRAELNGSWSATLTHPIDKDGRWKYIVENAVVKMPSFNGDQLFRIISKKKADSGVTAQMEPIFYDAISDCWLTDIRPTGKNGQEALDLMLAPNAKYSARSDITKANTAYYQYVNFFEALNGDIDQSFIKRWGGEILYDNFTIVVNERVGGDYGVELRYGKNIPEDGLSEEIDLSGVVTRIYPKAYNGYTMTGNGYVDSPLINNYPITHIATITFDDVKMREDAQEDDEENGVIICDTQEELGAALRKKCEEQYDAGLDKPTVTISADMILLQNTEQYKEYKILETVSLGDTIHCKHSKLGIVTDARVISLEYDSIRKKVTAVTLGDYTYNYFDNVTSSTDRIDHVIRPDGTVMADKVAGILNGIYTQLRLKSTAAQKVDGVAFKVEDLDPDSPLYGCMIWGTQGLQISNKRTADDKDWDWTTAFTAKGGYADALVLGILSDQLGRNYWNLETGEFRLSSEAFIGDKTVDDFVSGIFNDKMTQEEIFNALTDNGKVQGIYMQNGQLYVNGEYVRVDDLVSMGATIGGWKINSTNLRSPSGNLVMDSGAGTIYTIRQNGNKGVIFLDDGIELYSWALDGNFIGRISTGNFPDTLVQAVTFYSDYGDMIMFGMQTQAKDETNIQLALSDRETNGYKIGINALKTIHAFGDIYSRSKLYIGSSNANPYFQLNSDGGIFVSTSKLYVAGIISGDAVYSAGRRTATCNNQIYFQWEPSMGKIAVFADSTFIGYLSF